MASTFGGDPEFFAYKEGVNVPAHLLKMPPVHQAKRTTHGSFFRDGWAVEINFNPHSCRPIALNHFRTTTLAACDFVERQGYTLVAAPAIAIDLGMLNNAPADVSMFGCHAASSAYSDEPVRPDLDASTHPFRYGGGHFHISSLTKHVVHDLQANNEVKYLRSDFMWYHDLRMCQEVVKLWDAFVGLPLTYLYGTKRDRLRRKYYGQAGEFRVQSDHRWAGLEYRTPPPIAFCYYPVAEMILGVMRQIHTWAEHFVENFSLSNKTQREIRTVINAGVSHPDLLDLIADLKGFYNPRLLEKVRKITACLPTDVRTLLEAWPKNLHAQGWETVVMDVLKDKIGEIPAAMYPEPS